MHKVPSSGQAKYQLPEAFLVAFDASRCFITSWLSHSTMFGILIRHLSGNLVNRVCDLSFTFYDFAVADDYLHYYTQKNFDFLDVWT